MRTLDPQSLTRHIDRLYRAAWALCGSREDAEDLVQDTFARVLARPRLLRGDDELAYLMRVLRNTFFSARRTAARRPVTAASLEDVVAADSQPTGQPEQALEMRELYAAIAALPEDFRLALVAVDIVGLSYREAARSLRTREATITTRLFRARRQVVRKIEQGAPGTRGQRLRSDSSSGAHAQRSSSGSRGAQADARSVDRQGPPGDTASAREDRRRGASQREGRGASQREGSAPGERLSEQGKL